MTKYLVLVKHSVPKIEKDRPASDWRLSQEGQSRAQRLAEQLANFEPEVIVSSNEPKAKETAEIVAGSFQLDVQVVRGLHEHDRSNIPYLSHDMFHSSMHDFFQKPHEIVFGRETAHQAYTRFYQTVHAILNDYLNKTVIVVTHGTVISLFVSRLTGTSDLELWNSLGLPSFVALDLHSNTVIVKNNIL